MTPDHVIQLLSAALLMSEIMANVPWIKANSWFQLITGVLQGLLKKKP